MNWISADLKQYKGNFHTHTTLSDGGVSPGECIRRYHELHYDILAITDHRSVTHAEHLAPKNMLLLPGTELDTQADGQVTHVLGLGVGDEVIRRYDPLGTAQQAIDAIRASGGAAVLAHPAWSLNPPEYIRTLHGLCGAEIWNTVSTVPYNGMRGESSVLLDLVSAAGTLLPVFANDDCHYYDRDFAGGFTVVQACELTAPAVMEALQNGHFYASQGPRINALTMADGRVRVECSEARYIVFYSAAVWSGQRVAQGEALTSAEYTVTDPAHDRFIRVQVIDRLGRSAWSAPYALI